MPAEAGNQQDTERWLFAFAGMTKTHACFKPKVQNENPDSHRSGNRGSGFVQLIATVNTVSEDIQKKMVAFVIRASRRVEVVPVLVVHRNPLLRSVPIVHVVLAAPLLLEVVGIVHVRIIIEAVPVGRLASSSGLSVACVAKHRHQGEQNQPRLHESSEHMLPLHFWSRTERNRTWSATQANSKDRFTFEWFCQKYPSSTSLSIGILLTNPSHP